MRPLRIDPRPASAICNEQFRRPEGVAFSKDGRFVAVADPDACRVFLHERCGETGSYGTSPVVVIGGAGSGLDYPHDVGFSPDDRLLVVANRDAPSITFYARERDASLRYGTRPVWTIQGRASRLVHTDGAQFVPPTGAFVAAVNRLSSSVTFFRRERGWLGRVRFERRPCFTLEGVETRLFHPDGLAFSTDGALMAVSNHGIHSVTIYARAPHEPAYQSIPVAEIRGGESRLRFPHSLAFSPDGALLAVSNAGGRTVTLFRRGEDGTRPAMSWPSPPALELVACDPARFEASNGANPQEGGGKGVAFGGDCFAFCNTEIGLRIHPVLG